MNPDPIQPDNIGSAPQPPAPQVFQPAQAIQPQPEAQFQPSATPQQSTPQVFQPTQAVSPTPSQPQPEPSPLQSPTPTPASQPTPPVSPQTPQGPVYGGVIQPPVGIPSGPSPRKKRLIITAATAGLTILLVAGAVFGLYLPNQPENVYRSGISRTGKTVDKLITSATEEEKIKQYESSELSGSLEVNGPNTKFSGSFNSKYDDKQSDTSLSYKNVAGEGTAQEFSVQLLSDLAEGKTYPDIFFKISGLGTLGIDEYLPQLKNYDGKWIAATSDYIQSITPQDEKAPDPQNEFTEKEAAELAKIVSGTMREYVFSTDPDKAVLTQKSFVGTEKVEDGITANHYKVGVNDENAKKFCKAMIERFTGAEAYKKIPGVNPDSIKEDTEAAVKSCQENIENDPSNDETFDMWIDKKHKLIHKIRLTDPEEKGTYLDIGQNYKKGDMLPIFVVYHSDEEKSDVRLTLDVDVEKSVTKGSLEVKTDGEEKWTVKANFEFKPHDGDVQVEKPKDAIPIQDVLNAFGVDPAMLGGLDGGTGAVTVGGQDSERQTDIKAIHGQLEAFYAQEGRYPLLGEMNNDAWRRNNMRGLDDEALKAPGGTAAALAASATASQYAYVPRDCAANNDCQAYTLIAKLSDGSEYKKESLN